MGKMTHDELVIRAGRWLRNTRGCGVVLVEFHTRAACIPDAIGFTTRGAYCGVRSVMVECKTSVSDFYADKKKRGRHRPDQAGELRYYMTEAGLLGEDRVTRNAPGWGLLEVHGRRVVMVKESTPFTSDERATQDIAILYSYVRRVSQYGLHLDVVQGLCSGEAERRRVVDYDQKT